MSRESILNQLRENSPLIAPSMLKCDFGNLQREVAMLESAGAKVLHLDVMDGHFVPNLSYGAMVIDRLRRMTNLVFDAHLMISNPDQYLDDFLSAGCQAVTFHVEAVANPADLLQRIRKADAIAGLAVNPGTPIDTIQDLVPECDLILIMSVEPGFGGQQFIASSLDKLREVKQVAGGESLLSIDGGIGPSTISEASKAGADIFVVGSAVFEANDYGDAIAELTQLAAAA